MAGSSVLWTWDRQHITVQSHGRTNCLPQPESKERGQHAARGATSQVLFPPHRAALKTKLIMYKPFGDLQNLNINWPMR